MPQEGVAVRLAPGIIRDGLLQVGTAPAGRAVGRRRGQQGEPFLGGRVTADVEPELVHGLAQHIDLRLRRCFLGFIDIGKEPRTDDAREQADDDQYHQKLEQGKAGMALDRHGFVFREALDG